MIRKYKEMLLYIVFGLTTTVVNWCVYACCCELLGITAGNAVAWAAAVVYAFVTNKLFVFGSKSFAPKVVAAEAVKFFSARALSGVLEVFLPTALVSVGLDQSLLGLEGGVAKALVSVFVIASNYVFSKWIVFAKGKAMDNDP